MYEYLLCDKRKTLFCISFRSTNFGDNLNKVLIERITGKNIHIVHVNHLKYPLINKLYNDKILFSAIGSIMHYVPENAFVWGTGCVYWTPIPFGAQKILSVRGPMTASVLEKSGFCCPDIFGDPALLYRKYFNPPEVSAKKFKIGIVPHSSEKRLRTVRDLSEIEGIKIIDVDDDIQSVVGSVLECEVVFSSSLHGLIISDVMQVPNTWVRFGKDFPGHNFKFNDYYSSLKGVNDLSLAPIFLDSQNDIPSFIKSACRNSRVHEHHLNLDLMVNVLGDRLKFLRIL